MMPFSNNNALRRTLKTAYFIFALVCLEDCLNLTDERLILLSFKLLSQPLKLKKRRIIGTLQSKNRTMALPSVLKCYFASVFIFISLYGQIK